MLFKSAMLIALTFILATLAFGILSKDPPLEREAATAAEQDVTNDVKSQATAKELDDAATPVVDLVSSYPAALSTERLLKNSRYDNEGIVKSDIDPKATEVVRESPEEISDIPTDESDLVVEGRVSDSAAFLSNDKGAVYSEVTVQVSDVLKKASDVSVKIGDSIVAERFGGRVRYPNGKIVRYGIIGQGSPERGKKYLFFFARAEQGNYRILTAYELSGNKVQALDGSRINYGQLGKWSFDKHNDEGYQSFRKSVEQAVETYRAGNKSRRFNP